MDNFFSYLDSRILEIDWGKLLDFAYLTDLNPGDFYYAHWAVALSILAGVTGSTIYRIFKRPRKNLAAGRRMAFRDVGLRQAALSMAFLAYLLFRSINTPFISMRLWMVVIILAGVVNVFYAIVKALQARGENKEEVATSVQGYQQYLPKKKKKK